MNSQGSTVGSRQLNSKLETRSSKLLNEDGIALAMVLVISVILLAIMTGLLLFVTSGVQVSGIQKRYKSALDAGTGGAEVAYQIVALRGDTATTDVFKTSLNTLLNNSFSFNTSTSSNCVSTGLLNKLNDKTASWDTNCDKTLTVGPSSYDMKFDLGTIPTYTVYAKIVDTVEGNSGSDEGLINPGVVKEGESHGKHVSYLYTIEVDAENKDNPAERAKLSILYQY